jgi:hypothetical protein
MIKTRYPDDQNNMYKQFLEIQKGATKLSEEADWISADGTKDDA